MNPTKSRIFKIILLATSFFLITGCGENGNSDGNIRPLADTIGFAQYPYQMEQMLDEINRAWGSRIDAMLSDAGITEKDQWKTVISPHDDYGYAGFLYPAALRNVKGHTVILLGVAHKARLLHLEDQLVFDSHDAWKGPYGPVKVSDAREYLITQLPLQAFQVNDSMHRMEHSLEALIPFLQEQKRNIEIVPVLIPYMPFEKMNTLAIPLAEAIKAMAEQRNWQWGKDFTLVISNDAVHYGDEDWGGKNYARYGTDSIGYRSAVEHEWEIIQTLAGELHPENIRSFCEYTVAEADYKEYKWPWCGRYSVPFGLLTSFHLNHLIYSQPLVGYPVGYASSIDHEPLQVEALGMGFTAPANLRHWVGYAVIGYK